MSINTESFQYSLGPIGTATIQVQDRDTVYVRTDGYALTINRVSYSCHQHFYRHADNTWHPYPAGERWGSVYLSREDYKDASASARSKFVEVVAVNLDCIASARPELFEAADKSDNAERIQQRRADIARAQRLIEALESEIDALENGSRHDYQRTSQMSSRKESGLTHPDGSFTVAASWDTVR